MIMLTTVSAAGIMNFREAPEEYAKIKNRENVITPNTIIPELTPSHPFPIETAATASGWMKPCQLKESYPMELVQGFASSPFSRYMKLNGMNHLLSPLQFIGTSIRITARQINP